MNINSIILILLFVLCGCKNSTVNSGVLPQQEIIFEAEYVNFAWGVTWKGMYVAENGDVHTYDRSGDPVQWVEDEDGFFTKEELLSKYGRRDTLRTRIPADSLLMMKQLTMSIDARSYSDTANVGADMGAWTTTVYIYRSERQQYQRIILSCDGDREFNNVSPNAKNLSGILKR
ncbi:MAG: hypothetical protein ACOYNS_06960, partial [Bacteroidota bacterium]